MVEEVTNWTRKQPTADLSPSIGYEEIVKYHTGFNCVRNSKKYMDKCTPKLLMYASPKSPHQCLYKVSMSRFWKKGVKRIVFIKYEKNLPLWSLCSCSRSKLGLCIHSAVAMLYELCKRDPTVHSSYFQKNKDGVNRHTSDDLVQLLQADGFSKKRSRTFEKASATLKHRKYRR